MRTARMQLTPKRISPKNWLLLAVVAAVCGMTHRVQAEVVDQCLRERLSVFVQKKSVKRAAWEMLGKK